ncbi:MAG: SRPBCC domain-containing protein [Pseudomonadota bacterium]
MTTPDAKQFLFDRRYPISPDRLWHLLTDPKMRERWGAPTDDMVLEVETSDLRVGGLDRHRCGPKEKPEFTVETRWYRIDAPDLAVYTETIIAEGDAIGTSLVTYKLAQDGAHTALAIAVAVSSFHGAEVLGEIEAGWGGGLSNLDRLVALEGASAEA